mgnify:CR=1 FL=1
MPSHHRLRRQHRLRMYCVLRHRLHHQSRDHQHHQYHPLHLNHHRRRRHLAQIVHQQRGQRQRFRLSLLRRHSPVQRQQSLQSADLRRLHLLRSY